MRSRVLVGTAASALALAAILGLPVLSAGGQLRDSGGGSDQTVTVKPSKPAATPLREAQQRVAVPGTTPYVPPLHGANPHGQGTVGTIDLTPSGTRPLPVDPTTGEALAPNGEEIVVGRARGEQRANGQYHGHITILSLFGNEIAGVDTNQGETKDGPLQSIQQNVLDPLCPNGVGLICLQLLRAHSETTATSSSNEFKVADLRVASTAPGTGSLRAQAAESRGNISSDGTCQTAHGDSLLTGVTIGAGATVLPQIQAVNASSDSRACRGQAPTQTNSSDVITPDIGIPPLVPAGCGSGGPNGTGTPNTLGGIPTLLPLVCNADDSNGSQADDPYGVREALSLFALVTPPDSALVKVTAGAAESRASAPAAVVTPPGGTPPGGTPPGGTPPGGTPPGGGGPGGGGPGGGGPGGGDDGDNDNAGDNDGGGDGDDGDDGDNAGDSGRGGRGDGGGAPQCSDGVDNDGDGKVDFPNDPQCSSRSDDSEANGALAFTGADLLLIALAGAIMLAAGLALRNAVTRAPRMAA